MTKKQAKDVLDVFEFEGDDSDFEDGGSIQDADNDCEAEDEDQVDQEIQQAAQRIGVNFCGSEEEMDAAQSDGFLISYDFDDEPMVIDEPPLASTARKTGEIQGPNKRSWQRIGSELNDLTFHGDPQVAFDGDLKSPYSYFKDFITDEMLEHLASQTMLYNQQCHHEKEVAERVAQSSSPNSTSTGSIRGRPPMRPRDNQADMSVCSSISTGEKSSQSKHPARSFSAQDGVKSVASEIEMLIGILLRMGITPYPHVFDYWQKHLRMHQIADCMSRDRFWFLMRHLHFRDNNSVTEAEKKSDRVWKMRLWFNMLHLQFTQVPPLQYLSVDEQMIPYKGRNIMKQYMPNKPTKRGFKVWALADNSGYVHKFEMYTGLRSAEAKLADKQGGLGMGGSVVLNMISEIPAGCNFKIFSDRFFNSLKLFEKLKEMGYEATGTVMLNRIEKPPLKMEKELKTAGRGSSDEVVEINSGVRVVSWLDSKLVTLCSTYAGTHPEDTCRRWLAKDSKFVEIKRPAIIREYNTFMGGVDLSDMLRSMYSHSLRCRRWYMYHFMYTLHLAVRNAWILYRRHAAQTDTKPLSLKFFILDIFATIAQKK